MGGEGSGNWYRFDKKTTTGECHSVDVHYLRREGLLKAGNWFSLRWSRAGRETGSIRCVVEENDRPGQVLLFYRHRNGQGTNGKTCMSPYPLTGRRATLGERGRGSSVPERDAAEG